MRRAGLIMASAMLLIGGGAVAYTKVAARTLSGQVPNMAAPAELADRLLVEKSARRLSLWREGRMIAEYEIALGADGDGGAKRFEGDERTPEGRYVIDWRNPRSIAHLSLHISYPAPADMAHAQEQGRDPGGSIMIHGLPNGWGFIGGLHRMMDWTDGCIAVTNDEMQQIWARVPDGTEIEIRA